jgi:hypothetical protein
MNVAYSLRETSERPLREIDDILFRYVRTNRAKLLFNYRDYPSRTIYWKKGRQIRFIQIRLDAIQSNYHDAALRYDVFECSYKIFFPLLTFWNARFDVGRTGCKKVGTLISPIDQEKLSYLLNSLI